jgi:hypothetical protein
LTTHRPAANKLTGSNVAAEVRRNLDARGGLFRAFRQFLLWRTDLLPLDWIEEFRHVPVTPEPMTREAVCHLLISELPNSSTELCDRMDPTPLWSSVSRTAFRTCFEGVPVVVHVAHPPFVQAEFEVFGKALPLLVREAPGLYRTAVLREFRAWMDAGLHSSREQSYLEVLRRSKDSTVAAYPDVIPELCSSRVTSWPWTYARPASELLASGDLDAVVSFSTAILEQLCSLSLVEAEMTLDSLAIDDNGRVIVRRLSRPVSVPPSLVNDGMKYIASVFSANDPAAANTLLKLCTGTAPGHLARKLLDAFSGIEPSLRVGLQFPASCETFDGNWRALAAINVPRPLFLNCLHRNIVQLGYWSAAARTSFEGIPPKSDPLEDGYWPVVSRMMKTQFGTLLDREKASEWIVSTGLLSMGAVKQMNRMAEELRSNDLSPETGMTGTAGSGVVRWVLLAVFAGLLAVSVHFSVTLQNPWDRAAGVVAIAAVFGLIRVVAS